MSKNDGSAARRPRGIMSNFLTPLVLVGASALAACADLGSAEPSLPVPDRGTGQGYGTSEAPAPPRLPPQTVIVPPPDRSYQSAPSDAEARRQLDEMFRSWLAERQAAAPPTAKPPEPAPQASEPAPALPATPAPSPAPHTPPPDVQAGNDPKQQPPMIDSRPPGTRCGYWQLCNLWE